MSREATQGLGIISARFPQVAEFVDLEQVEDVYNGSDGRCLSGDTDVYGGQHRDFPSVTLCECSIHDLPPDFLTSTISHMEENIPKMKE